MNRGKVEKAEQSDSDARDDDCLEEHRPMRSKHDPLPDQKRSVSSGARTSSYRSDDRDRDESQPRGGRSTEDDDRGRQPRHLPQDTRKTEQRDGAVDRHETPGIFGRTVHCPQTSGNTQESGARSATGSAGSLSCRSVPTASPSSGVNVERNSSGLATPIACNASVVRR